MTAESKGRDLFIVDNSVSGWTGLRYLEEWTGIATGYFEIGALLALDGKWQPLEKIRILMGAEMTYRTRKALLEAVRSRAVEILDGSIEAEKEANPFLHGVPPILEALQSRQIECRVYDREKFHAKAYITHARLEVVGSQALVGSSNFTAPGLTKNIELNIQVQSGREIAQLQEWFEAHWNDASEVTDAVIDTISRHTHLYPPFDIYAKALQEFFRGHELTATEWDETRSKMFSRIDRYQKEAYWALLKIARQHGGAFLCDGVGLGKTFVGLMLIERLVLHEGKRVVLFAPKATKEGVWEPHLREWLPHIGGVGGNADFSNLAVANTGLHEKIWLVPAAPPRGRASLMPGRQAGHLGGRARASGPPSVAAKTSTPPPPARAPSKGRPSLDHQTLRDPTSRPRAPRSRERPPFLLCLQCLVGRPFRRLVPHSRESARMMGRMPMSSATPPKAVVTQAARLARRDTRADLVAHIA